jgi:hypothetical protein
MGRIKPRRTRALHWMLPPGPRAYVVGHPLASPDLRVSLHDTFLLDADER